MWRLALASPGGLRRPCVRDLGLVRVSSHRGAQGTPTPLVTTGDQVHLPFSSTAYTDVWPTDTCFSLCLAGDGMWYQQSPAEEGQTWVCPGSTGPATPGARGPWPPLQLPGGWGALPCPADLQHPGLSRPQKGRGRFQAVGLEGPVSQAHPVPSPACGQEPALQLLCKPEARGPVWTARCTSLHLFIRPPGAALPGRTLSRHPVKNTPA